VTVWKKRRHELSKLFNRQKRTWFPATNWKETVSPSLAVTLLGVKVSAPFWATTTVILAAEAQAARPKRVETAAAKRISQIDGDKRRKYNRDRCDFRGVS